MAESTNGTSAPALCNSAKDFLEHSYDYIIVGGGSAGLVLAARLTENPNVHVGVLEAGKNKMADMMVNVPVLFTKMLGDPEYDWNMKSVPQASLVVQGFRYLSNSCRKGIEIWSMRRCVGRCSEDRVPSM